MLQTAAATSHCKELLQDPQPAQRPPRPTPAAGTPPTPAILRAASPNEPAAGGHQIIDAGTAIATDMDCSHSDNAGGLCAVSLGATGYRAPGSRISSADKAAVACTPAEGLCLSSVGAVHNTLARKKAGRVQDNPDFFRT